MEAVRSGVLGRAVLYEVAAEGEGGKNLKECTKDADGKVKSAASGGVCGRGGERRRVIIPLNSVNTSICVPEEGRAAAGRDFKKR